MNRDPQQIRVAFYVHPTAFQERGGAEVQLLKTAKYLAAHGITVKFFDSWNDRIEDFDLLHTFGSIKQSLPMMRLAKKQGVINVLSTICLHGWLLSWFTESRWKRRIMNLFRHTAKWSIPWIPSDRKEMMDISDLLLPNSDLEAAQLTRFFCQTPSKMQVIPNAVEPLYAHSKPDLFIDRYKIRDFILCVGRIEPRKNQLNLIRAFRNTSIPVVIIGKPVSQYEAYFRQCHIEATPNIQFLGGMGVDEQMLQSAYAACKVFVLPSWCETPGLAALEAGLAGAHVVITNQGATREYFLDYAAYVHPFSVAQIRTKTLEKWEQPKTTELKNHIANHYTWERTASLTASAYRRALDKSRFISRAGLGSEEQSGATSF